MVAVVALVGGLVVGSGDDEQGLDVLGPGTTHLVPDLGEDGLVSAAEAFTAEDVRSGAHHPVDGVWGPVVWLWTPDGTVPTDVEQATTTPYVLLTGRAWGPTTGDGSVATWQVVGAAADGSAIERLGVTAAELDGDPVPEPLAGTTLTFTGRDAMTEVQIRARGIDPSVVVGLLDELVAVAMPGDPSAGIDWPGLEGALIDVPALPQPADDGGRDRGPHRPGRGGAGPRPAGRRRAGRGRGRPARR